MSKHERSGRLATMHSIEAGLLAARAARVAGLLCLLLLMTACAGAPYPSGNPDTGGCMGFAGMPVPNCDFYR